MNTALSPRITASLALAVAFIGTSLTANAGSCFVWRVTNTKAPCYLVGTIHALSAHDWPIPQPYYQALEDSKRLVFEMNMYPPADYREKFVRAATYPKGDSLERHVHPKTWEIIRVNFTKVNLLGRPFRVGGYYVQHGVEQLRPWAIASIFYRIPGYSDVYSKLGVDRYLASEGRRKGKELAGLESDEQHIAVLGGMDDLESELILLDAIVNRDKEKGWEEQARTAWKHGDIAGVRQYLARFGNLNPGAHVRLLDERNIKWVPKIKAEFDSGKPTSIVVGTGHMLGPNGLLALLERKGYKFEQL